MPGDIRAVTAIVQIVRARVPLNGLDPARDGPGPYPSRPGSV